MYVDEGLSIRQIGARLGMGHTLVRKQMVALGVARRPQMLHDALDRGYFDSIDTADKAYILGLLWADGTLDPNTCQVRLRLAAEDRTLLDEIGQRLGIGRLHEIAPSGNAKSDQVGLFISSKQIVSALQRLGLTPAKDYTLPQPVLPAAHLRGDFVRGLIDGDGCLQFVHGTPRMSFRNRNAALRAVVQACWSDITDETAKLDATVHRQSQRIYPSIYLSGRGSVRAARVLYANGLMLPRKRTTADSFARWVPHRRGRDLEVCV
jgi:hypothetical protein